jgi:hypothetical protein
MDGQLAVKKMVNGHHLQRFARKLEGSPQPTKLDQMVIIKPRDISPLKQFYVRGHKNICLCISA